jgi:hypothetical protein
MLWNLERIFDTWRQTDMQTHGLFRHPAPRQQSRSQCSTQKGQPKKSGDWCPRRWRYFWQVASLPDSLVVGGIALGWQAKEAVRSKLRD